MARARGRAELEIKIAKEKGRPQAVRHDPKMCDVYAEIRAAKPEVKERIIRRLRH